MAAHRGYGTFEEAVALWFGGEEPPTKRAEKIAIERPTYKLTCGICGSRFEAKAIHGRYCKGCAADNKRARAIAYYHRKQQGEGSTNGGTANNASHSANNNKTTKAI